MRSPLASPEVPCVRCHERVAGLAWGARCPVCDAARRKRATGLARRISLLAALVAASVLSLTMPAATESRVWIGIGTLASYLLVRTVAFRTAMEFLPD